MGKIERIELDSKELQQLFGSDEITDDTIDELNMMLLIKDQYNISSTAYHELSQVCKSLPHSYKLKQKIKELNSLWDIRPTPHGIIGYQQSLEEHLHTRVQQLLKTSIEDAQFKKSMNNDRQEITRRNFHLYTFR